MKKIVLIMLALSPLALTGCLSTVQQVYLQCNDTGAKEISTSDSSGSINKGWFGGLATNSSSQTASYDCDKILARKDVKKSLQEKGYLKGQ
ncbi:MAG: hypothetical protein QM529_07030 [Hydrotalea sp.]|nr:hypothetical protein [Hydrotalea sp.]